MMRPKPQAKAPLDPPIDDSIDEVAQPVDSQIRGTKGVLRSDKVGKINPGPKKVTTVSHPNTTVHSVYYT